MAQSTAQASRGGGPHREAARRLERDQRLGGRVAVPIGEIGTFFGPAAYPAEAVRAAEQGRTVAMLTIAADGRVANCAVHDSSGSASLDRRTCEIALTRLSFRPPNARRGRALTSNYLPPVRWVLPTDTDTLPAMDVARVAEMNHEMSIEVTFDQEGKAVSCSMRDAPSGEPDECSRYLLGRPVSPPLLREGRAVGGKIVFRYTATLTADP